MKAPQLHLAWLILPASVLIASCGGEPTSAGPETVYTLSPPTWFEDGWSYYEVAPDGWSTLFGARFGFQLIDLRARRESPVRYLGRLHDVSAAVFDRDGNLVRLGTLDGQTGWYVASGEGPPRLSPLPPDAVPRWSPDGSRVAYHRRAETGLFVGPPQRPNRYDLGAVTGVSWSDSGEFVYALVLQADGLSSLMRVDVEDGTVETVAEGLDATPRFNSIGVSPDGRSLYVALAGDAAPDPEDRHRPDADRDMDIYRVDVETGGIEAVVTDAGDDFYPIVAGGHLYWTHNEIDDDVVVIPSAGGDARVVVEDAQIPYWSHDGGRIGFTYGGWRIADWALNLDAGTVEVDREARVRSDPVPIVVGYHEDFTPAWSPDGEWIAYHSHRSDGPVSGYSSEGSTDDIYLRRSSAPLDEEIRLTDFGWEVGMADWAPDGRRLVFDSWERGGAPGVAKPWIATIDAASGRLVGIDPLPLPDGFGGTLLAAWSPRDDRLAVVERIEGERQALWVLSVDGTTAERLLEFRSRTYGGVDWTPDAATIVYAALADGRMQLFAIPSGGGESRQLTHDDAGLIQPQVSPDGRWIAATRIDRSKELRRMQLR